MLPIYIGYFTPAYRYEAAACAQSLDAFGLEHDIRQVPDAGEWCANCAQKPRIVMEAMARHPGRPLVYVDVDARIRRYPWLFDSMAPDVDLACHFRHGVELLSGTLYVGTTPGAANLVRRWHDECRARPNVWDQISLQKIIAPYIVYRLPAEYTRIFDDPKMGEPVIEHLQASRRLKHAI